MEEGCNSKLSSSIVGYFEVGFSEDLSNRPPTQKKIIPKTITETRATDPFDPLGVSPSKPLSFHLCGGENNAIGCLPKQSYAEVYCKETWWQPCRDKHRATFPLLFSEICFVVIVLKKKRLHYEPPRRINFDFHSRAGQSL